MIDVTVKVPEERVPEFYSMYGAWLNGTLATQTGSTRGASESPQDLPPWTDADAALAAQVWTKLSPAARGLFSILIAEPERKFSGDQLGEALRLENKKHGVAGLLGWPGRHCVSANRRWLWEWEYPGDTAVYWFTQENAALFGAARDGLSN